MCCFLMNSILDINYVDTSSCANDGWLPCPQPGSFPVELERSPIDLFKEAVSSGDLSTMGALLLQQSDLISILESTQDSPLFNTTLFPNTFLFLLQNGATLDSINRHGETVLQTLITLMPLLPLEREKIYETSLHAHRHLTTNQLNELRKLQFSNHPVLNILVNGDKAYAHELMVLISFQICSMVFSQISYYPYPSHFVPEIFDQKIKALDSSKKEKLITSIADTSRDILHTYGVAPLVCAWAHSERGSETYKHLSLLLEELTALSPSDISQIKNLLDSNPHWISHVGASALQCIRICKEGYNGMPVQITDCGHMTFPSMSLHFIPINRRGLYWL